MSYTFLLPSGKGRFSWKNMTSPKGRFFCGKNMYLENRPNIQEQNCLRPVISTESIDGVTIGRANVRVRPFLLDERKRAEIDSFTVALEGTDADAGIRLKRSIAFHLNNNTAMQDPLSFERPVSAYFTFDAHNKQLIIEWGKIDPGNKEAKLHTYLNQSIDYRSRVAGGMKLSSGHIAKMTTGEWSIALLDNLPRTEEFVEPSSQMGKMINTLYAAGIIPITPDGSVRKPSAYNQMRQNKMYAVSAV